MREKGGMEGGREGEGNNEYRRLLYTKLLSCDLGDGDSTQLFSMLFVHHN